MLLLLSVAVFISAFATDGFCLRASATSTPPDKARVFGYGTDPCAVYVVNNVTDKPATYRVYADSRRSTLLGEGYANVSGKFYCVIPLPYWSSAVYVTRQEAGEAESQCTEIAIGYTPSIQLKLREIKTPSQSIPLTYDSSSGAATFYGNYVSLNAGGYQLKKDTYYQAEILLNRFTGIDTVRIPLRYDTELLEPASISNLKLGALSASSLASAAAGKSITFSGGTSTYGVLKGTGFSTWDSGAAFSGASGGAYQYLNTTTGLFKLQASTGGMPAAFGTNEIVTGSTRKTPEFVRIFFRAKETVQIETLPVWFATEADCPAAKLGTAQAEQYYDITSPNGISATLCGTDVLAPPPVLKTVGTDTAAVLSLSASDMQALPDTYYAKTADVSQLAPDEVRIYNYTNWHKDGEGLAQFTLDGGNSDAFDRLVIDGNCSSIKQGDEIRVYNSLPVNHDSPFLSGEYDANQGVTINLGSQFLQPTGGTVYVSVVRKDASGGIGFQSTATDCPVNYPAEASRDVTFRIYRSSWEDETVQAKAYGDQNGKKPTGDVGTHTGTPLQDVSVGERLQIRVYFNNFYELMSYGFAIRFDPDRVHVADVDYNRVDTGTVFEQDYKDEKSCFSVGKDLANVTLTEQAIYQAWQRQDETEIESLMTLLDLTRTDFDQKAADVQVKYSTGVTEDGTNTIPWKGGLLFNQRNDASGFPYVDQEGGVVRFVSATLEQTPLTLERAGGGYHFISINFVADADGDPGFRLAEDGDAGYDDLQGQEIVLVGGVTGLKTQTRWEVWPMGNRVEITLRSGNALLEDDDLTGEFLFDGTPYRDPGYEVRRADGSRISKEKISRWYTDAEGIDHDLPWSENEELPDFRVAAGKYSTGYVIYYRYTTEDGTNQTVQAERNIYVIFRKGDVNRDGVIDIFDEQALADHLNASALSMYISNARLCNDLSEPTYPLFLKKTADLDQNGSIQKKDREALRDHNLGIKAIQQDYVMRVP